MRRLFPTPFGRREGWLTALAVGMAAGSGWLNYAAGMGGGSVLMLCVVIGTLFLILVAGDDRCFFTALFNGLFVAGTMMVMLVPLNLMGHYSFSWGGAILLPLVLSAFVSIPTTIAWLVTYIRRIIKRRR